MTEKKTEEQKEEKDLKDLNINEHKKTRSKRTARISSKDKEVTKLKVELSEIKDKYIRLYLWRFINDTDDL